MHGPNARRGRRGAAFLEYLVIFVFIALAVAGAAMAIGEKINKAYKHADTQVQTIQTEADKIKVK